MKTTIKQQRELDAALLRYPLEQQAEFLLDATTNAHKGMSISAKLQKALKAAGGAALPDATMADLVCSIDDVADHYLRAPAREDVKQSNHTMKELAAACVNELDEHEGLNGITPRISRRRLTEALREALYQNFIIWRKKEPYRPEFIAIAPARGDLASKAGAVFLSVTAPRFADSRWKLKDGSWGFALNLKSASKFSTKEKAQEAARLFDKAELTDGWRGKIGWRVMSHGAYCKNQRRQQLSNS